MKIWLQYCVIGVVLLGFASPLWAQEVIVLGGVEETLALLKEDDWWGQAKRGEQLNVPRTLIVALSERWQKNSAKLPVDTKKDIFYSAILPLAVHANTMVLDRRKRLQGLDQAMSKGNTLSGEDKAWLSDIAVVLPYKEMPCSGSWRNYRISRLKVKG